MAGPRDAQRLSSRRSKTRQHPLDCWRHTTARLGKAEGLLGRLSRNAQQPMTSGQRTPPAGAAATAPRSRAPAAGVKIPATLSGGGGGKILNSAWRTRSAVSHVARPAGARSLRPAVLAGDDAQHGPPLPGPEGRSGIPAILSQLGSVSSARRALNDLVRVVVGASTAAGNTVSGPRSTALSMPSISQCCGQSPGPLWMFASVADRWPAHGGSSAVATPGQWLMPTGPWPSRHRHVEAFDLPARLLRLGVDVWRSAERRSFSLLNLVAAYRNAAGSRSGKATSLKQAAKRLGAEQAAHRSLCGQAPRMRSTIAAVVGPPRRVTCSLPQRVRAA